MTQYYPVQCQEFVCGAAVMKWGEASSPERNRAHALLQCVGRGQPRPTSTGSAHAIPIRVELGKMINELDRVVLTEPVPKELPEKGDVGTVVHVYDDGKGHEVEFTTLDGQTAAVVTVEASQIGPVSRREITYARERTSLNDDDVIARSLD
jgi:hypothetical protein